MNRKRGKKRPLSKKTQEKDRKKHVKKRRKTNNNNNRKKSNKISTTATTPKYKHPWEASAKNAKNRQLNKSNNF